MFRDNHDQVITVASEAAARAYDSVIEAYLLNRADLPVRLNALLELDPSFALGACLKGLFTMMGHNRSKLAVARSGAAEARGLAATATRREQGHVAALEAWIEEGPDRAAAIWEEILREHPTDILAFRLAHFVVFWLGRPDLMLRSVQQVEPHWSEALPGWGTLLACRCFALEECGHYTEAEAAGRAAIECNPADLWAAHGVAHVMEMQGRRAEGLAWIDGLRRNWTEGNNLRHHLWWHAALHHLERGENARVLELYDSAFRDLNAPLTQANPDLYIDVQNAASILFRLGLRGVDAGGRWTELADKAEARVGDCLSPFTLPHWIMALAATGRFAAAERFMDAMRGFAEGAGILPRIVRTAALPVSEAVLHHARGQYAQAVAAMRPALGGMYVMGGSHAQQDVLEQLYLDSAVKAGLAEDVRMLLQRAAGRHPVPPSRRAGYAQAATAYG